MDKFYAQALWNLVGGTTPQDGVNAKKLVAQLVAHLEKRGRLRLLPGILRSLQRLDARHAKLAPHVEVAHESDATKALKEAAARGVHADRAHVNHDLIKGWRASSHSKLVDQSAKRELIDLYRRITA